MKQKLALLGVTNDAINGRIKELMEKKHRIDFIKLANIFKAGRSYILCLTSFFRFIKS